jgi:hypothetical protein
VSKDTLALNKPGAKFLVTMIILAPTLPALHRPSFDRQP